jgi:2-amino-4-hydroxy-6-hydroxymethyldihydropteridine diphosphokinase
VITSVPTGTEALAYIALGGNLGDAKAAVRSAIAHIGTLPHTTLVAWSSLYRTAPVDSVGPDFINAVIGIQSKLDAHELLLKLQHIETLAGRERPYPNAPRTLDLDVLLYGQAHIDSPQLVVPHPRMYERAFVLVPLAEIAPELVSTAQLAAVAKQRIERLEAV